MLLFYVPCPSLGEAKKIAEILVNEKIAVCGNIIKDIESYYTWKGKLCNENEVLLILKTLGENKDKLEKRIKELHSYDVPCILSIKTYSENKEYLDWVKKELGG